MREITIPVLLRNRLIRTVLGHTEISCIASYYRQFSTNKAIKIIKLIPGLRPPCGLQTAMLGKNIVFLN